MSGAAIPSYHVGIVVLTQTRAEPTYRVQVVVEPAKKVISWYATSPGRPGINHNATAYVDGAMARRVTGASASPSNNIANL